MKDLDNNNNNKTKTKTKTKTKNDTKKRHKEAKEKRDHIPEKGFPSARGVTTFCDALQDVCRNWRCISAEC